MFILIENHGEAFIEAFTTLGISTSRGDDGKIGQFGSGAKMAILQLIREGASPIIYSGLTKVEFLTKPAKIKDKIYNKVFCLINGQEKEMGFSLEYGELDWTTPWMSLREFVSNAIDETSFDDVTLTIKDKVRAKSGNTRIFIPATIKVIEAFNQLSSRFLHFSYSQDKEVIEKEEVSKCKIYRKGVFVRELTVNSLYDYNLTVPVDDCRNCDDWTARWHIQRSLNLSVSQWEKVLQHTGEVIENTSSSPVNSENMVQAYQNLYGDTPVCDPLMYSVVQYKNSNWKVLPAFLVNSLKGKVKSHEDFLSKLERDGHTIEQPTPLMRQTFEQCVQFLNTIGYHFELPALKGFVSQMDNGKMTMGYVENNIVYINKDNETSRSTMLEELCHYITGAGDCTRDFQTIAFDIAAKAMEYFI